MRTNGDKRGRKARLKLELALELRLIDDARHTPDHLQREALAWLRRWRRRPDRVFWEVQPTGGQRLL
jgi:enoyl-CoA hydratase/carnithine racemase